MKIKKLIGDKATVKLTYEVYEDKYCEWYLTRGAILGLLQKNKPIPPSILKRFLNCIKHKNYKRVNDIIRKLTNETVSHFDLPQYKRFKYNFSKVVKKKSTGAMMDIPEPEEKFTQHSRWEKKGDIIEIEYSLRGLSEQIFREVLMYGRPSSSLNVEISKHLRFIHDNVKYYTDKRLPSQQRFTDYGKRVIAGYIATKLSLLPPEEEYKGSDFHQFLAERMMTYSTPLKKDTAKNKSK